MRPARSRLHRLVTITLAVICALVIMQADLARATVWRFGLTETYTFSDGTGATYAPTWGQAYTRVWSNADQFPGAYVYIDAWMVGFWFSSQKIANLNSLYQQQRYFTADMSHPNDYDTTVSVEGYSTTLPNAHYDWDDNPEPFGNGYADESEVTVTNPAPMQAYWSYDFLTVFRDMTRGNTAGYFEATAQRSFYDPLFGEYNTEFYFGLATPDYNSYGLMAGCRPPWLLLPTARHRHPR